MEIGQLGDLGSDPRASLSLLRCRVTGVPHEIVGDELSTPFERGEKRHLPVRANQFDGGVHLYHRQPPARLRWHRLRECEPSLEPAMRPVPPEMSHDRRFWVLAVQLS